MTSETLINSELERYFLGACMVEPQVFTETWLTPEDFGTVDHQLIYAAIVDLHEETKQTDPVLVADYLNKSGHLNRAGGTDYIYELQSAIAETISATLYGKEIQRLSKQRKAIQLMSTSLSNMKELNADPDQIFASLQQASEQLFTQKQSLESYTAYELSKMEIEPVKWFIPGFLPSGLTILSGPPKIGKSFFCWNMALAVALGGTAFSSVILPKSYNVSYLSLEDPIDLLKDRLEMISPDELPKNLHIIDDMKGMKLDHAGLKEVGKHLDATESELLIVDTWKHTTPDIDIKGTSYDIDYANLIPIQNFAHNRKMGVILVTHNRKAADIENAFNQIQGSVGMQAGCDTLMMISHDSGSKTLHLSGRRIPAEQFAFSIENGFWKLEGDAEEFHGSELRREIKSLLKEAGAYGLSASDLIDLTGKKDSNVRQTLRRMVKNNEIDQPKKRGDYFYKDDDDDE